MANRAQMVIDIEVDDKGSPVIKNLGSLSNKTSDKIEKGNKRVAKSYNVVDKAIDGTVKKIGAMAAAYLSFQGVKATGVIADDYTMVSAKIKLATESQEEYNTTYQALYDMSRETGSQMVINAASLNKLALNSTFSIGDVVKSQEILNKSMVVTGASTQENTSFMMQYAQAMGSGVVNGDEFRSMSEANSYIIKLIAEELGTNIRGLKEWGAQGKLTSEMFFAALLSVEADVNRRFVEMPVTVSRALNDISEVVNSLIADTNNGTGATNDLARAISDMADTTDDNRDTIVGLFSAIVTGATKGLDIVGQLTGSIQGLAIVAASEDKSLLDWVFSDADDMKRWQADVDSGVAFIDDKLEVLARKKKSISAGWTMSGQGVPDGAYDVVNKQIAALEKQRESLKDYAIARSLNDAFKGVDVVPTASYDTTNDSWLSEAAERAAANDRALELIDAAEEAAYLKAVQRANKQIALSADLEDKIKQMSLSTYEYELWLLEQELSVWRETANGKKEILDQIDAYAKARYIEIDIQLNEDVDSELDSFFGEIDEMAGKQVETQNELGDAMAGYANGFGAVLMDSFTEGESALLSFGQKISETFMDIFLQTQIIGPAINSMFGAGTVSGGTSFFSMFAGAFSSGAGMAYADGGMINEPVAGIGLNSGKSYTFAEREPEGIFNQAQLKALGTGGNKSQSPQVQVAPQDIKVINVESRDEVPSWASSSAGEKVIVNIISRNRHVFQ